MADSKKAKLFKTYLSRMNTIKKDKFAAELFAALGAGKNSYMRIDRLESSNFDMAWIKAIENCIYDLGEIVANPKEVTKTVTGIVPVELARKTGAESVQHLASHTQYIKEITEEGDVVPNKILNIGSEEDIHTYENRFIATLIRRLVLFIEKRYEVVKNFATLHDEEILYYKTKAIVDGSEVEIETKIKVRSESDSEAAITSNNYVARIVKLREYVKYFYGSKFMKELKTERDVRNPIVMTNILRKNPKYHKCYELFRFIERYDKLGVSYKLDEDASMFSDDELAELNTVMLTNYLALKGKDRSKVTKGFSRTYKPKILTSIDDEQFIYGDLLRGPIEFLRVDQGYQDYLDEQIKKDLPPHPTKIEKDYYEEELEAKNTRKAEKAALDKLAKRKKKEQAEFDRRAKAIVAQREKEEQERLEREAAAARKEEERKIEEVRQALVRDALFGNDANPEFEEGQSAPIEEEQPVEEIPVVEEVVEEAPVEEPAEEIQEEPVQEEEVSEQVEEQPQEVEENIEPAIEEASVEEQSVETEPAESPVEEPAEEPEPEEVFNEQPTEEDIDAIRQQLIADALAEEEVPAEEPQEEAVEEAIEETPVEEPAEEVQEQPIQEEVVEQPAPEVVEEPEPEETPQPEEPVMEQPVEEEIPAEEPVVEKPVVKEKPKPFKVQFKRRDGTMVTIYNKKPKVEAPVVEEAPVEQPQETPVEPVVEQPVEEEVIEQPIPEVVEEAPVEEVVEETPVEEPAEEVQEQPVQEEEIVEQVEPEIEEQPVHQENEENNEIPAEKPVSAVKKPVKKKKKIKKSPQQPKEQPAKIPGRFIVKTAEGYYVNPKKWSIYKHEAYIFDDFNAANRVKNEFGGKVVKL